MRMGFKGSTTRLAVLVALVVLALTLVAAPAASAAGTTPCLVFGNVQGHYYGGNHALQGTVDVFNGPTKLGEATVFNGIFQLVVDVPLPQYAVTLSATTHDLGPIVNSAYAWTTFFTAGTTSGIAPTYTTSGDFAYTPGVMLTAQVLPTTVKGTVTDAKTKKALSGVKVVVGNVFALTSKGKYSATNTLWPGKNRVTYSKKGYKSVTKTITSNPGGAAVSQNVVLKKK
jgi:hypothetical protein